VREAIIRVSHEGPKTPCLSRPTASLPACSRYLDPACLRGIGAGIVLLVGQLILDADASNWNRKETEAAYWSKSLSYRH
jgi:hypothetical protein